MTCYASILTWVVCAWSMLLAPIHALPAKVAHKPAYFYDEHHVRYELYKAGDTQGYNWLFVPGGPGADSCYMRSLADVLDLPGNVWLVDLPGVGSNQKDSEPVDFNEWFEIFPRVVDKFSNPIVVGHSFGGMFPLCFPQMEDTLKGFVILGSAPSLWMEAAAKYAQQFDVPDLTPQMTAFVQNPSQETFNVALDACMPYYFPDKTLEKGRALLADVPFSYLPAVWWQQKAIELNFTAKWVPQQIPILIIGGKRDCICPYTLFAEDKRFKRDNIEQIVLEDTGHIAWLDNPEAVQAAFKALLSKLNQ